MNFISLFLHGMNLGIFKNEGKLKRFHKVFKVVKNHKKIDLIKVYFYKKIKTIVLIHLN